MKQVIKNLRKLWIVAPVLAMTGCVSDRDVARCLFLASLTAKPGVNEQKPEQHDGTKPYGYVRYVREKSRNENQY